MDAFLVTYKGNHRRAPKLFFCLLFHCLWAYVVQGFSNTGYAQQTSVFCKTGCIASGSGLLNVFH